MNVYNTHVGGRLMEIYEQLLTAFGPESWWPAESSLEIVVGAVLTQNTSWGNVEKAIASLRERDLLPWGMGNMTPQQAAAAAQEAGRKILALPEEELAESIRPAGFYRLKARRLKNVLAFLDDVCAFDIGWLSGSRRHDDGTLRRALLRLGGVGPETADDILLYALNRPSFVVDAYTLRLFARHRLLPVVRNYESVRTMFMRALPQDVALYKSYHGFIVRACKEWCVKHRPSCPTCPLGRGLWAGVTLLH